MSRLQRTLIEEVRAYAKAQNFDLVIADGVIYSTPALDITPAILSALQAEAPKPAAAAAPPRRRRSRAGEVSRPVARQSLPARAASMSVSLGELAVRFGCELRGDPDVRVDSIAPLSDRACRARSRSSPIRSCGPSSRRRAPRVVVLDAKSAAACPGRGAGRGQSSRHLRAHRGAALSAAGSAGRHSSFRGRRAGCAGRSDRARRRVRRHRRRRR